MSLLRQGLNQLAERWLLRFRLRHELNTPSASAQPEAARAERVLLHVGCGSSTIDQIPLAGFRQKDWNEIRLDADERVNPDLTGSMVRMTAVADGLADAVYSSHNIEHLHSHEVPLALAEFLRVLKPDGFVVITCPDAQAAAQMVAEDRMYEIAYQSAAGPITYFDILYGYRPYVANSPQWMAHHCCFTLSTLKAVLREAGFAVVHGARRPAAFDLWALASKSQRSPEEMAALAQDYLLPSA